MVTETAPPCYQCASLSPVLPSSTPVTADGGKQVRDVRECQSDEGVSGGAERTARGALLVQELLYSLLHCGQLGAGVTHIFPDVGDVG